VNRRRSEATQWTIDLDFYILDLMWLVGCWDSLSLPPSTINICGLVWQILWVQIHFQRPNNSVIKMLRTHPHPTRTHLSTSNLSLWVRFRFPPSPAEDNCSKKSQTNLIMIINRIFESICWSVCLFVHSITQKRMIPKCSILVYGMNLGYPTSDMILGWKVKGQR